MNCAFGYARVSTRSQTTDAQESLLAEAGCKEIFTETESGAKQSRPELERLLDKLREGDTVVIVKLDRLSRSVSDLLMIVQRIESCGAHLRSLRDPLLDTTTPNGKLVFGLFGLLAAYERDLTRERTLDGLAAARASGKRLGRPEALNGDQRESLVKLRREGWSYSKLARTFRVAKATVIRYVQMSELAEDESHPEPPMT